MPAEMRTFHCEVEKFGDETLGRVAWVVCHGDLVNQTAVEGRDEAADRNRARSF